MKGFTIISYPTHSDDGLLSLTQQRSRYMLPLGGRFRVADFTIRNSVSSGADGTIIYTGKENDGLKKYLREYQKSQKNTAAEDSGETSEKETESSEKEGHSIQAFALTKSNLNSVLEVIKECKSSKFVLYNGDTPSIIDFRALLAKFKTSKKKSLLFKLQLNGKATMAHKIVICEKRNLLSVIKKAIAQKYEAPNFFEMIINMLIHNGISTSTMDAWYWPIKDIREYYELNYKIIWDKGISELLQSEGVLKSQIKSDQYAQIDRFGSAKNSFLSDYCYLNGRIENSIIFPGVEIHENAYVKDSIILPFVSIGPNARIINTIVDENLDREADQFIIGENTRIGSEDEHIRNADFPKLLNSSITLIGKKNFIPRDTRIGAACYVSNEKSDAFTYENKILKDGESLL